MLNMGDFYRLEDGVNIVGDAYEEERISQLLPNNLGAVEYALLLQKLSESSPLDNGYICQRRQIGVI